MGYATPRALEMALKEAARKSPLGTSRAISGFYFHRLLCRIFSDPCSPFILKGGQGMLARMLDARVTRDIDLSVADSNLDYAVDLLIKLSAVDLGDFVSFQFDHREQIKTTEQYRAGCRIVFRVYLGGKSMSPVSIDLVSDVVGAECYDVITPMDRVSLDGVPECDYRVYSPSSALADKFCGIIERHDGRPSSRQKDLVDIVMMITNLDFDLDDVSARLERELRVRQLEKPRVFSVPAEWKEKDSGRHELIASRTGMPEAFISLQSSESLASIFFDTALSGEGFNLTWVHQKLEWLPE